MAKWRACLEDAVDRLWFLPAILTPVAMGVAVATVRVDQQFPGVEPDGGPVGLIFRGGAEAARSVLAAIAGGVITVTGVVFSITLVALRAASEQFTPRLLREFTSDRPSQATLGVFTATFVYSLMVLRAVRSEGETGGPFVPALSVTVAFGLALASIGFLIFFIGHVAQEIEAAAVVERVARRIGERVERLAPVGAGRGEVPGSVEASVPGEAPAVVVARAAGYVREVDEEALFARADGRLLLRLEVGAGSFVVPGTPLVSVWPAAAVDAELGRALRGAFALGRDRAIREDVEHGFIELSDIAVKALSPGINDPTTANFCIDRLSEALAALGRRDFPAAARLGRDGRVCLIARRPDYGRIVAVAFDQIRNYARSDPSVLRRLLEALGRVAARVPENRRAPLRAQAVAILRQAEQNVKEPLDLEKVRSAGRWAGGEAGGRAAPD